MNGKDRENRNLVKNIDLGYLGENVARRILRRKRFTYILRLEAVLVESEQVMKTLSHWQGERITKDEREKLHDELDDITDPDIHMFSALGREHTEKLLELKRYAEGLRKRLRRKSIASSHYVIPDFIAKRKGQWHLIEAKVNTSQVKTGQNMVLEKARKLGFVPLLVKLNIAVDVHSWELEYV